MSSLFIQPNPFFGEYFNYPVSDYQIPFDTTIFDKMLNSKPIISEQLYLDLVKYDIKPVDIPNINTTNNYNNSTSYTEGYSGTVKDNTETVNNNSNVINNNTSMDAGSSPGYGFTLEGKVEKGYNENWFTAIFGDIGQAFSDAGSYIGSFFGSATGSFSNSVGNAVGLPSWLIPATVLIVGVGGGVLLIYLLIKK